MESTALSSGTVIENVPAVLVVKEAREHRWVLINRAGEALYGVPREEMIGKNAHDFFPQKDADYITSRDKEVLRSGAQLFLEEHPIQIPGKGIRLVTSRRLASMATQTFSRKAGSPSIARTSDGDAS